MSIIDLAWYALAGAAAYYALAALAALGFAAWFIPHFLRARRTIERRRREIEDSIGERQASIRRGARRADKRFRL